MLIILENENGVCVDWNNYDLSLDEAATELLEGRNVVAREFVDYSDDDSFPEVDELLAINYTGKTKHEIIESIRGWYESFGRAS